MKWTFTAIAALVFVAGPALLSVISMAIFKHVGIGYMVGINMSLGLCWWVLMMGCVLLAVRYWRQPKPDGE